MTKQQILNYLKTHKKEFQKKYELESKGLFDSYAIDDTKGYRV